MTGGAGVAQRNSVWAELLPLNRDGSRPALLPPLPGTQAKAPPQVRPQVLQPKGALPPGQLHTSSDMASHKWSQNGIPVGASQRCTLRPEAAMCLTGRVTAASVGLLHRPS